MLSHFSVLTESLKCNFSCAKTHWNCNVKWADFPGINKNYFQICKLVNKLAANSLCAIHCKRMDELLRHTPEISATLKSLWHEANSMLYNNSRTNRRTGAWAWRTTNLRWCGLRQGGNVYFCNSIAEKQKKYFENQ